MAWRIIMRYLANNEQLIEKLSESNVMRRAAQVTVYTLLKWRQHFGPKSLREAWKSVSHDTPSRNQGHSTLSSRILDEIKTGLREFKDEMNRRNRR